jgi:hypothetical protein
MNALQQRMMANAGMLSEEMEGGALLPSQQSIKTTTRTYDKDNLNIISTSRRRVPGIGPVTANNPRILRPKRFKNDPQAQAWKADPANADAVARLKIAQERRAEYASMRRNGQFDDLLVLKERRKAEAKQRAADAKAERGGEPAELTPALRAAQEARQWKSQLREMVGKSAADKYVEALKLSRRNGNIRIAVDKVLVDPFSLEDILAHYKGSLLRREAAKARAGNPELLAAAKAERARAREANKPPAKPRKPRAPAKPKAKSRKSKKPTQAAAE